MLTFICTRYSHGNYLETLNFIWKIPEETSEFCETLKAQMITRINDTISIYYTRQMRKNVFQKVSYKRLTFTYAFLLIFY